MSDSARSATAQARASVVARDTIAATEAGRRKRPCPGTRRGASDGALGVRDPQDPVVVWLVAVEGAPVAVTASKEEADVVMTQVPEGVFAELYWGWSEDGLE